MPYVVHLFGNSIARGLLFVLSALLRHDFPTAERVRYTDARHKERLCDKTSPFVSCSQELNCFAKDVALRNSWTQRLDQLSRQLRHAFDAPSAPDLVVIEVGLDHLAMEWNSAASGRPQWMRSMDEAMPGLVRLLAGFLAAHRSARVIWRATTHFNESGCWSAHLTNRDVDLWDARLHASLSPLDAEPRFTFDRAMSRLVDHALTPPWTPRGAQRGAASQPQAYARPKPRMHDWVHPSNAILIEYLRDNVLTVLDDVLNVVDGLIDGEHEACELASAG